MSPTVAIAFCVFLAIATLAVVIATVSKGWLGQ
jgi:hypothetical protein